MLSDTTKHLKKNTELRYSNSKALELNVTRKTFMAIHKFHSDEAKQEFFRGMPKSETTDREWAEGQSFEKCRCVATWAGKDDFFFCPWEAESQADFISTLTAKGLDEFIFTAVYPTLMHIVQNNLSGRTPLKNMTGWDS